MRARQTAVVIGGGVSGLTAAAYLARAGRKVTVVEARERFGGRAETVMIGENVSVPLIAHCVYALDPHVVRDLRLHRRGLKFAERAMPLVALHTGGRHLVLPHNVFAARAAIREQAVQDANSYLWFRRRMTSLARRMRAFWTPRNIAEDQSTETTVLGIARTLGFTEKEYAHLETLARTSASAYLDSWFETDTLKAALAVDAEVGGVSPHESGSALSLLWRASQESAGMQGAVAQLRGGMGALADVLAQAASEAGAELRTGMRVDRIRIENGRAAGVVTENGETLVADAVLSSLGLRRTLLELVSPESLKFGVALRLSKPVRLAVGRVYCVLDGLPPFAGLSLQDLRGRLIVAERPESAAEAKGAALLGQLPPELVLEATVPTVADPDLAAEGLHLLSVRVPYLPLKVARGWRERRDELGKRVMQALETFAPGLSTRVTFVEVLTPEDIEARYGAADADALSLHARLLTSYPARIRTPIPGLYLCGSAAEPADAVSGRAARLAAQMVIAQENDDGGRNSIRGTR